MMNFQTICLLLTLALANFTFASEHPNVIIVMTDDQGYGELSCHGNPILQTPHLDQLAAESIRLTDFHVAPMCTPTRGQLLTGLDAFRNGAMNVSSGRTLLRPELTTMADIFQAADYHTGIFGKWHLGDNYPFRPEDRGFEEAIWFPSSHINSVPDFWNNDYFEDTYIHNTKRERYSGYCTDVFFQEAISWMESLQDDRPFFAYIPLNAAHWPHFVPDHYRQSIKRSMEQNPQIIKHLPKGKQDALASFLAMCANIDENIGRLNSTLLKSGRHKNTILIFLTDNGSTMGQDYFNAGMRGKKTELWEGGHRVPCLIRWPNGNIQSSVAIDELCHVQDLLPTLIDLCKLPEKPNTFDGISLGPLFRGEQSELPDRMLVINYSRMPGKKVNYTELPHIPAREGAGVLWKKWRLLEDRELYDIESDPHQDHNVVAEYPEIVRRMSMHLDQWWEGVREDVMEPQRVVIGSERENPMLLTACEWLDVFVDQQRQIRRGDLKNGRWHLDVDQPGLYHFELRRWPRESGKELSEGVPSLTVTDGVFAAGKALPITQARLSIGEFDEVRPADLNGEFCHFECQLDSGPVELQTWMMTQDGESICGAYYVYVKRIIE